MEVLILKKSNKKKLSLLLEKAKELGLELVVKTIKKDEEWSEKKEKEAFLYTSKVNASKIFEKYL